MNTCCLQVIERYLALLGSAADGAALYCKECTARIESHDGVWGTA